MDNLAELSLGYFSFLFPDPKISTVHSETATGSQLALTAGGRSFALTLAPDGTLSVDGAVNIADHSAAVAYFSSHQMADRRGQTAGRSYGLNDAMRLADKLEPFEPEPLLDKQLDTSLRKRRMGSKDSTFVLDVITIALDHFGGSMTGPISPDSPPRMPTIRDTVDAEIAACQSNADAKREEATMMDAVNKGLVSWDVVADYVREKEGLTDPTEIRDKTNDFIKEARKLGRRIEGEAEREWKKTITTNPDTLQQFDQKLQSEFKMNLPPDPSEADDFLNFIKKSREYQSKKRSDDKEEKEKK